MIEQISEMIQDLRRREAACEVLADSYDEEGYSRCKGKASAYGHSAELLENILKDHEVGK